MGQMKAQYPKAVVVATDFTPAAELAVEQAAQLAKFWGSELHVLHASRADNTDTQTEAQARLDKHRENLSSDPGMRVSTLLATGRASVEIARAVSALGADLVVVGEHSRGWLKDGFLGGTALKVLHEAEVPVLLVRARPGNAFAKIMVATDFSDNALRAARLAVAMFPGADLSVQHAFSLQNLHRMRLDGESPEAMAAYRQNLLKAADRDMARLRKKMHLPADRAVRWSIVGETENHLDILLGLLQKESPDLLVVGKHGGSAIDERFFGSATEYLLYRAQTNVLLVP